MTLIGRGSTSAAIWRLLDGYIQLGLHSSSFAESFLLGSSGSRGWSFHSSSSCGSSHADGAGSPKEHAGNKGQGSPPDGQMDGGRGVRLRSAFHTSGERRHRREGVHQPKPLLHGSAVPGTSSAGSHWQPLTVKAQTSSSSHLEVTREWRQGPPRSSHATARADDHSSVGRQLGDDVAAAFRGKLDEVRDIGSLARFVREVVALPLHGDSHVPVFDRARVLGEAAQHLRAFAELRQRKDRGGQGGRPLDSREVVGVVAAEVNSSAVLSSIGSELQRCLDFVAIRADASNQQNQRPSKKTQMSGDLLLNAVRQYAVACTSVDFRPRRDLVDSGFRLIQRKLTVICKHFNGVPWSRGPSACELTECTIALLRVPGVWDAWLMPSPAPGEGQPPRASASAQSSDDNVQGGHPDTEQVGAAAREGQMAAAEQELRARAKPSVVMFDEECEWAPAAVMKLATPFMDMSQLARVAESMLPYLASPNLHFEEPLILSLPSASAPFTGHEAGQCVPPTPGIPIMTRIAMQLSERAAEIISQRRDAHLKDIGEAALALLPAMSQRGPVLGESNPALIGLAAEVNSFSSSDARSGSRLKLKEREPSSAQDLAVLLALVGSGAVRGALSAAVLKLVSHLELSGALLGVGERDVSLSMDRATSLLSMDRAMSRSAAELWVWTLRGMEVLHDRCAGQEPSVRGTTESQCPRFSSFLM